MKKPIRRIMIFCLILLVVGAAAVKISLGSVGNSDDIVKFVAAEGDTYYSLAPKLKEAKLIRSETAYKLYVKLTKPTSFQAGKYPMKQSMSVKEIVEMLEKSATYNPDAVIILFPEGKNMRGIAKIIANNTNNTEEDVFALLKDEAFIEEMIAKYWFLTPDIQNEQIYYPLEGYLFPDTYEFSDKDVTVKEIFLVMLNETNKKLEPYKAEMQGGKYTIHEYMTLASIIENESWNSDDRAGIAGVFYNRLNAGWPLGSDVTTYYAVQVDMGERDLYKSELEAYNAYNTRSSKMAGKLPVGPICNPGIDSIKAAVRPAEHEYFYFAADKNRKTYFTKTYDEHKKVIADLKSKGLWYVHE